MTHFIDLGGGDSIVVNERVLLLLLAADLVYWSRDWTRFFPYSKVTAEHVRAFVTTVSE